MSLVEVRPRPGILGSARSTAVSDERISAIIKAISYFRRMYLDVQESDVDVYEVMFNLCDVQIIDM